MKYSVHLLRHTRTIIGQNINARRHALKWPLKKLARVSGVSESALDCFELGKHDIRLEDLTRIACAFDVSVTELMS